MGWESTWHLERPENFELLDSTHKIFNLVFISLEYVKNHTNDLVKWLLLFTMAIDMISKTYKAENQPHCSIHDAE